MGPLQGVRVVDLSHLVAGPFCTALLGDLGAEIIKVERPEGDDSRRFFPLVNGESLAFMQINRNKRSVRLDVRRPEGLQWLRRLFQTADIVVESFRPGTARRLGIGYEDVRSLKPDVIYASISGFGQTGPMAERGGVDIIAQGIAGIMSSTGEPGRPPVKVSMPVTDIAGAMYATVGILSAYAHRLRTGEGQYVETSLVDAGLAWQIWDLAHYLGTGEAPPRLGSAHRLVAPYQAFPSSDGYLTIAIPNQSLWERLCDALDAPELKEDPRFASNDARVRHRDELAAAISERTRRDTTEQWLRRLEEAGIPSGPILHIGEALEHPQIKAREMPVQLEHPVAGTVTHLNTPLKFSATEVGPRSAAPLLGDATEDVLRQLGATDSELAALRDEGII